jgi:signal transduction histidine kinase/ligand-binding sensor domain-containing protein
VKARLLAAVLLLTLVQPPAVGAEPLSVAQLRHTAWKGDATVPGSISAIIQTRDGYLWMGSGDGLSRFDGVGFETFSPANDNPLAALAARDILETRSGELWVGLAGNGGVAIFRDGHFVNAGLPHPSRETLELEQDLDGAIWAASARPTRSLARFANGRWEDLDDSWGVPDGWVSAMLVGRDGTLWVAVTEGLAFLRRGSRRFETIVAYPAGTLAGLAEDAYGHIWIEDRASVRRLPDYTRGQTSSKGLPRYSVTSFHRRPRIAFAPDGSLWGATGSAGVFRIDSPQSAGVMTTYGLADGLSDNEATSLFADREGTVWTGGERGLNAFSRTSLVWESRVPTGAAPYYIAGDDGGRVYVTDGATLFLIRPGQPTRAIRPDLTGVETLCRGRDGGVWVFEASRIEKLVDGRTVARLGLAGHGGASTCGEDADGRLWFVSNELKLWRHDAAGWSDQTGRLGGAAPEEVYIDRRGRPIISLGHTALMRLDGPAGTSWSADRLRLGRMTLVRDTAGGLVAGGSAGLLRIGAGGMQRLDGRRHPWLRNVRALQETPGGEVWLYSYTAVIRLKAADLDKAFAHPDRPIPHRLFDQVDGLASGAARLEGDRMARGGDGRLWLVGRQGIMWLAENGLAANPLPPPIHIRAIRAGGQLLRGVAAATLPKGARDLQIDYVGLSMRTPERVRFRYRLEGVDRAWVEAGGRRTAFYNSLPPGHYRFRVMGANDDGVWNRTAASALITVPPMFWQTPWFMILCGLAATGLAWLLYRLRLRAVAARIQAGMGERLAERERIARELHDTLLQGVQGLILRFQLIADDLPAGQPQRAAMEGALETADEVLALARDRVQDLRKTDLSGDLEAILASLAQAGEPGRSPPVGIFIDGAPRPLERIAGDELMQIVGEALANARRHAGAACIEIRARFGLAGLTLVVIDDGRGIDPDILGRGGRDGHFGLAGMGERARRIRARIRIDCPPAGGTRVTVTVPARIAYAPRPLRPWLAGLFRRPGHD